MAIPDELKTAFSCARIRMDSDPLEYAIERLNFSISSPPVGIRVPLVSVILPIDGDRSAPTDSIVKCTLATPPVPLLLLYTPSLNVTLTELLSSERLDKPSISGAESSFSSISISKPSLKGIPDRFTGCGANTPLKSCSFGAKKIVEPSAGGFIRGKRSSVYPGYGLFSSG